MCQTVSGPSALPHERVSGFQEIFFRGNWNPRNFSCVILLHEKFLQFDWLRAVVFQLNKKYLHVEITKLLPVAV